MSNKELFRRYSIFGIALFITALGVSFVTKSMLGTSPISSFPFVVSLNTPPSMGTYIFALNVLLIIVQMTLLGREGIRSRKMDLLLQLPTSVVFGACIDLTMWMLSDYHPELYPLRIFSVVVGCLILGVGISMEVIANVTMMSAEYTVQTIARKFNQKFGNVKLCFDLTLVVISVSTSLAMAGKIEGIREGTLIAALLTGPFVRLITPLLNPIAKWLDKQKPLAQPMLATASQVITISREYGSGGHVVGKAIAERLGIPFYDHKLITMVAQKSNMSEKDVSENEQNMPNRILYQMIMQDYGAPLDKSLSPQDALFVAQSSVIREIAAKGACVIIGRCADYILRDYPNRINIFLHASMNHKQQRVVEQYGIDPQDAQNQIERTDRARAEHYLHYTNQRWGELRNYHLTCDTSTISTTKICDIVESIYNVKKPNSQQLEN